MKKCLAFLLLLLFMPLCLVGCGDSLSEIYWIDSSKAFEEYFNSEQYLSVKNIQFDADLQVLMVQNYGTDYLELKAVYTTLFNCSISYANTYYVLLQNNPQVNNSQFKSKIKKLNKSLDSFKTSVNNFIKSKESFETYMDFIDESTAMSQLEQVRLLQFKQDYLTLIESAHTVSLNMLEASRVGYYDLNLKSKENSEILTDSNVRIAVYLTNTEILTTTIDMLKLYNDLDKYQGYAMHWNNTINYYDKILKVFESNTLIKTDEIDNALKNWKTYYDLYLQDKELFYDIKNDINFEKLNEVGHNSQTYAEKTNKPENKNKIDYFMNFANKTTRLISYTESLFIQE